MNVYKPPGASIQNELIVLPFLANRCGSVGVLLRQLEALAFLQGYQLTGQTLDATLLWVLFLSSNDAKHRNARNCTVLMKESRAFGLGIKSI